MKVESLTTARPLYIMVAGIFASVRAVSRRLFWISLLALWATAAQAAPNFSHEIYIWQRVWSAPILSVLDRSADMFDGYRVLAAETDPAGRLHAINADWRALERMRRPITLVVRIDGRVPHWDRAAMLGQIRALAKSWPQAAGIEIDYDCGVAHLQTYATFLSELRTLDGLPPRLSVTALPAWLEAPAFDQILAKADEVVLQVHAVQSPSNALFDAGLAQNWVGRMDRRTSKPFRVALPDYGTRVVRDDRGSVVAMESEVPRLIGGATARELMADPKDAASFLQALAKSPPRHFAGIVWFRLPAENDQRAWSLSTLQALMRDQPLMGQISLLTQPGMIAGATDIALRNDGEVDIMLPERVDLPSGCTLADGVNGYALQASKRGISLRRQQKTLLKAGHKQIIGWSRCRAGSGDYHVTP